MKKVINLRNKNAVGASHPTRKRVIKAWIHIFYGNISSPMIYWNKPSKQEYAIASEYGSVIVPCQISYTVKK